MITEDYISFNIAKILKEKRFNGEWYKYYWGYKSGKEFLTSGSYNSEYDYPAPTLQMVMKWLRKEHKIGVFPSTYTTIKGSNITHTYGTAIVNLNTYKLMTLDSMDRETYEEACEAAIKYCLENLI